ncbi:HDIG domain-containing protein [Cladophialophora immunda]|nr:HDIG domain-containing protein [Cladophialophora immunda]
MSLSEEQVRFFRENGYLILRDVLSEEETKDLQRWAQEVHDWPTDANSPWMPYEEINAQGKTVLCRTENYANSHAGLNGLLRGRKLLDLLKQMSGEDMLLFKEKINYKLAGSGGFAPHIDSTAYTHIKNIKHLAVLLAVDPSDMTNSGLEVRQLEFEEEEWESKPRAAKVASRIIDMLSLYGKSDYIGEPISQIEHSLQCAHLAAQSMADPQTVAVALLHDIGQFIPERDAEHILGGAQVQNMRQNSTIGPDSRSSDSVGRVSHETLGAQYLLALGFPAKVAALVEAHVPAKRYLCATEDGYYNTLSDASKESLRFQGGPMSPDEVQQWQESNWADEKANLRRWDDGAKVVGLTVPGLETYRPVLEQVLSS